MNILSLDASTKSTGWAIFEENKLKDYGCITSSSTDLVKRIAKMIDELDIILDNNKINKIILEEVRPEEKGVNNIKTHKALMYLQAAIVFLVHERHSKVEIEYIYPSSWRKACGIKTGSGVRREVLKVEDINFVKERYGLTVNDDIADAIGIGHAFVEDNQDRIEWQ